MIRMSEVVFVVAPNDFRDEELDHPRKVLENAGFDVIIASIAPGVCRGRFGLKVKATLDLKSALDEDADIVAFVGGGGAQVFFDNPDAHTLARETVARGKTCGAICIAPTTLGKAGLLNGYKATSFPSEQSTLTELGAKWTGTPVEVIHIVDTGADIITSNGPESAEKFGKALLKSARSRR